MITNNETTEVVRGGTSEEGAFKIKGTAKAFDILSSGLYSNKILAIVRELSCNAYDSHVAADKRATPVEIRLPSALDPTFHVRDFGTGLDHEDILGLYTTYFESTKSTSNDFIGALGLGSKSPFSYTSAFVVESRFNGTKRTYSAFKNEEGLPSITLMDTEETTDANGIQVSMPVRRDDIEKFHEAAKKALMYFNPIPRIVGRPGFEPYRVTHHVSGTNWKIRSADYYARMSGPYVVQGFVSYPIDAYVLKEHGLSHSAQTLLHTDIDLYVPIGKVEVAASREALSYTKHTIKNLIEFLEHVAAELRGSFQKEIDQCQTYWEAQLKFIGFSEAQELGGVFNTLQNRESFKWNGQFIDSTFDMDLSKVQNATVTRYSLSSQGGKKLKTGTNWNPGAMFKTVGGNVGKHVYFMTTNDTKGNSDIIRQFLQNASSRAVVYVFRPLVKGGLVQSEIDDVIAQIGNPELVKMEDLGLTAVKAKSYYVKKDKSSRLRWVGFSEKTNYRGRSEGLNETFSSKTWNREICDLAEGGVYVTIDRFSILREGTEYTEVQRMISQAIQLKLLPADLTIWGFTDKETELVADDEDWVCLFDMVDEAFKQANKNNNLTNLLINEKVENTPWFRFLRWNWKHVADQITDGPFKDLAQEMVDFHLNIGNSTISSSTVRNFLNYNHKSNMVSKAENRGYQMSVEWNKMLEKYPMAALIDWSTINHHNIKVVVEYINMVNSTLTQPE